MATDKVIATNAKALRAKYGADGFAKIAAALDAMVAADARRGLSTRVIPIDSSADMARYGAPSGGLGDKPGTPVDDDTRKLEL